MTANRIFWGDTHHNTFMGYRQDPPFEEVIRFAATYLDFYTAAYYTPKCRNAPVLAQSIQGTDPSAYTGIGIEEKKIRKKLEDEWRIVEQVTATCNQPGKFTIFPGYEWQGNGRWGDHNVIYFSEGCPVYLPDTLPELQQCLRRHQAIAIPHHTAYLPGLRAPRWTAEDEAVSPFAEIYSVHGCSESDEELIGMRNNTHMGPGTGGGTYQDALDRGLHLGAIASTDNWANMPGQWNQGLAACWAPECTRNAIWNAFRNRHVYGVSGDRIELDFTLNGYPMGSIMEHSDRRELSVTVRGMDAIDRIEILKNGRVIATHCHQGHWMPPQPGRRTRFRLRLEFGWASRPTELPLSPKTWHNVCRLDDGRFTDWSPGWISRNQSVPNLNGPSASFTCHTCQPTENTKHFNATILEFEADPGSGIEFQFADLADRCTVADLAKSSRLLWDRNEAQHRIERLTGITPDIPSRDDVYFHHAWKVKLHRAVPASGYCAQTQLTDTEPLNQETHYRVRVEQRNGQCAWSSPIWVKPADPARNHPSPSG